MANKGVEFEDEAEHEVEAAYNWYLQRSETAARNFLDELNRAVDSIGAAPNRWLRVHMGRDAYCFSTSLSSSSTANYPS